MYGRYLIVFFAFFGNFAAHALEPIDGSSRARSPRLIETVQFAARGTCAAESSVVAAGGGIGTPEICVVELDDAGRVTVRQFPIHPTSGPLPLTAIATDILQFDDYVVVAIRGFGISVLAISSSDRPRYAGELAAPRITGLARHGEYIVAFEPEGKIIYLKLSNDGTPLPVNTVECNRTLDIAAAGNHIMLVDGTSRLRVGRVTDNMDIVFDHELELEHRASRIANFQQMLLVGGTGLTIASVTDEHPVKHQSMEIDGLGGISQITTSVTGFIVCDINRGVGMKQGPSESIDWLFSVDEFGIPFTANRVRDTWVIATRSGQLHVVGLPEN